MLQRSRQAEQNKKRRQLEAPKQDAQGPFHDEYVKQVFSWWENLQQGNLQFEGCLQSRDKRDAIFSHGWPCLKDSGVRYIHTKTADPGSAVHGFDFRFHQWCFTSRKQKNFTISVSLHELYGEWLHKQCPGNGLQYFGHGTDSELVIAINCYPVRKYYYYPEVDPRYWVEGKERVCWCDMGNWVRHIPRCAWGHGEFIGIEEDAVIQSLKTQGVLVYGPERKQPEWVYAMREQVFEGPMPKPEGCDAPSQESTSEMVSGVDGGEGVCKTVAGSAIESPGPMSFCFAVSESEIEHGNTGGKACQVMGPRQQWSEFREDLFDWAAGTTFPDNKVAGHVRARAFTRNPTIHEVAKKKEIPREDIAKDNGLETLVNYLNVEWRDDSVIAQVLRLDALLNFKRGASQSVETYVRQLKEQAKTATADLVEIFKPDSIFGLVFGSSCGSVSGPAIQFV